MKSPILVAYISGLLTMGYVVAGLFFLRFWNRSRDRLFLIFAMAFWLLAAQRVLLGLDVAATEDRTWYYALRLVAFLLILVAIVDKNRGTRGAAE